jgi:hypothetical protein
VSSHDQILTAIPDVPPLQAPRVKGAASALVALGFIALVALFIVGDANRAWHAWLIGMVIPLFLSIAGLAYLAVHRLCGARWTAPLLRVAQGLTGGLPLTLVALIPFGLIGMPYVYEWAFLDGADKIGLLHSAAKATWLSADRVIITTGIALLLWMFIRMRLISLSLAETSAGDTRPAQVRWSVIFLLFTAYAFTLVAWDLILSLHVHAVSAMWGVYEFVGAVQAFLALLALCLVWLSNGPLKGIVREHTLKDLGTWLVGWSCVWAYITFAQYVIIAFANMDEETHWFLIRMQHGYQIPFVIECLLRLPLPFFLLLSQHTRTKPAWLATASVAILIGFVLQLCWQVIPALSPNHLTSFGWIPELMVAAGFLGGHLLLALHFWKRHGLVARGDRDLLPAINAEHLS